MKNKDVEKLAQLRGYIIDYYKKLDRNSPGISMTKTAEVAYFCESLVASIDDVVKKYVNFSKE